MRKSLKKKSRIRILITFAILVLAVLASSVFIIPNRGKIMRKIETVFGINIPKSEEEMKKEYPREYSSLVSKYAYQYNVPEYMVYGIIKAESDFIPDARSSANALGLMQITESTLWWINSKNNTNYEFSQMTDPEKNIHSGCFLISYLYNEDFKNWDCAIAAYNAGRARVKNWLEDPNISPDGVLTNIPVGETANYLKNVKYFAEQYRKLYYQDKNTEGQ